MVLQVLHWETSSESGIKCCTEGWRERGGDKERERQREREERKRERHTDKDRERQTETENNRQAY